VDAGEVEPPPTGLRLWIALAVLLLLGSAFTAALWLRRKKLDHGPHKATPVAAPPRAGKAATSIKSESASTKGMTPAPGVITFPCTGCGKKLRCKALAAGKRMKCPQCGAGVVIPNPPAPLPAVQEEN
jgi:hypothetical protein